MGDPSSTESRCSLLPSPTTSPFISVQDLRSSVKFQLRKVTCMGVAAGREDMTDDELRANIMMSLNFLVSLLKKGWHNLKSVNIKCRWARQSSSCEHCCNPFNETGVRSPAVFQIL